MPLAAVPGPSPRRRGSPVVGEHIGSRKGSIPAQAGEPLCAWRGGTAPRVHPRAGRGSHHLGKRRAVGRGSIPALAGEPSPTWAGRCLASVHPRAGGGAFTNLGGAVSGIGPSPRRRGSRRAAHRASAQHGSIPAQAGEPQSPRLGCAQKAVHPRAGGGAVPACERK
jgi:hypothetical protein